MSRTSRKTRLTRRLNYVDYVGTQVNTYEQQLNQVEQLKSLG